MTDAIGKTNESLSLWVLAADTPLLRLLEPFSKGVHRAIVKPCGVSKTKRRGLPKQRGRVSKTMGGQKKGKGEQNDGGPKQRGRVSKTMGGQNKGEG